jgi:hypothetical protein
MYSPISTVWYFYREQDLREDVQLCGTMEAKQKVPDEIIVKNL